MLQAVRAPAGGGTLSAPTLCCLDLLASVISLEWIRHDPKGAEHVPRPEGETQGTQRRGKALEVPRDETSGYSEPECSRKERHRDRRPAGEDQERPCGLGRIWNSSEQQQREPAGTADAMHQPDTIG